MEGIDLTQLPGGWLTPPEAEELQRLCAGHTVLELGAWKGRSTVVIASVADYVVSVDRHHGIPEHGDGEDTLSEYLAVVRQLSNVAVVVADFEKFVPLLGHVFDVAYVDGDHDEFSVWRDARFAFNHVVPSGTIAFHDWDFESVQTGAIRALGSSPRCVIGSVASFAVTGS